MAQQSPARHDKVISLRPQRQKLRRLHHTPRKVSQALDQASEDIVFHHCGRLRNLQQSPAEANSLPWYGFCLL